QSIEVYADSLVKVGNDYIIEVANNGDWTSGEFFEQLCETFHCEGYDEVILESAGGRVIFNGEGVTFEGNVRIEGELVFEHGSPDSVNPFDADINEEVELPQYRIQFKMLDDDGLPYANTQFSVLLPEGERKGITDENGMTPIFYTKSEETIKCHLYFDNTEEWKWQNE
ncbi:hypothetical protein EDC44_1516, partial [Cricetibacter osteomyelitidis]